MEYCEQDMGTLLDSMKTPYSISEVKCLMNQLLLGVQYCHNNFVIHRYQILFIFIYLFFEKKLIN